MTESSQNKPPAPLCIEIDELAQVAVPAGSAEPADLEAHSLRQILELARAHPIRTVAAGGPVTPVLCNREDAGSRDFDAAPRKPPEQQQGRPEPGTAPVTFTVEVTARSTSSSVPRRSAVGSRSERSVAERTASTPLPPG